MLDQQSTATVTATVNREWVDDTFAISFDYDRDGKTFIAGYRFSKVRAVRYRAELYLTEWHIEHAYDALVEVLDSEWISELRDAAPADLRDTWERHHYMLTLDSFGSIEVVAASWSAIPETPGIMTRNLGRK